MLCSVSVSVGIIGLFSCQLVGGVGPLASVQL